MKGQVSYRNHQNLKGNEITSDKQEENQKITLEPVNCQRKTGHTAQSHGANHRRYGNFETVHDEHEHRRIGEYVSQILDRLPLAWHTPQIARRNIGRPTHRRHHHTKQRHQPYQQGEWQRYFIKHLTFTIRFRQSFYLH